MKGRNLDCVDAFEYMLSLIFRSMTQIENCVSSILTTNMEVCQLLAEMRGTKCCVQETKFVKLHKQPNYFGFLPSEYLSKHINLGKPDNHVYCSQYSVNVYVKKKASTRIHRRSEEVYIIWKRE